MIDVYIEALNAIDGMKRVAFIETFEHLKAANEMVRARGMIILTARPATEADRAQFEARRTAAALKPAPDWIAQARINGDWSAVPLAEVEAAAKGIVLTTAFTVAGREVEHEIEIITAECSYGMNIFRDLFAGVRDIVGGRAASVQKVLRDSRRTVLSELKREALIIAADAVIGVDLAYEEIGESNMILVVATGTAVKLRPLPRRSDTPDL